MRKTNFKNEKQALWWIWFHPPTLFMFKWSPAWGSCRQKSIRPTTALTEGFFFFFWFLVSCSHFLSHFNWKHFIYVPSLVTFGCAVYEVRSWSYIQMLEKSYHAKLTSERRRAGLFFCYIVVFELHVVGTITAVLGRARKPRFFHLLLVFWWDNYGRSMLHILPVRQPLKQSDQQVCFKPELIQMDQIL